MKTILAFILILTLTSCTKSQDVNTETFIVSKTCLGELLSSNDEIECFSHYFDTKPEVIKANLNHFRVQYCSELRDKGWNPKSPFDLINFKVPFDKNGFIIDKAQWEKLNYIDNDNFEKTLFDYPLEY
jgi:hypothetical protein